MKLTAIVGATILDGTGRDPIADGVLLIEGDTIRSVSRAADTAIPEQAEIVDAAGAWVIPGMMDANVHLVAASAPEFALEFEDRFEDLALEGAQLMLKSGFTTVFETWGPAKALTAVRDRIARGEVPGSRMFVAGAIIGLSGPMSSDFYATGATFSEATATRINRHWESGVGADLLWLTPVGVRTRIREYIDTTGVDFLKYAASGHQEMNFIMFSAEAQRAIVEEGHRAGMTVQAHTTSVESLRMEIEAGADILQHGNITGRAPIPESTLRIIADRRLPVAALYYTDAYLAWAEDHVPPVWKVILNENLENNNRRLIETRANLLLTTDGYAYGPRHREHPSRRLFADAPDVPVQLGESHVHWVRAVLERGMRPMDALVAATSAPAKAYGHDDLGSLGAGKTADLVILDADPLTDPDNYRRIRAVFKDGADARIAELPDPRILTEEES